MDFQLKYAGELGKLKENEDNVKLFKDVAVKFLHNNLNELKKLVDGLLIFSDENKLYKTRAWALYYLGWYNFNTSNYDEAAENFLNSHDIFENTEDSIGIIYACNGLTNVYCQIGQFKLANEWGLKGISLSEEINEKDALTILLINTGINYIQMNYFKNAKELFNSIEIMGFELTSEQRVSCKLSLAEVEINVGNPEVALAYIEEVSRIKEHANISTGTSEMYKLKGMAYIKLNEYDVAEQELIKSYDFSDKKGLIYEKCSAMVEWAKLCILVGRNTEAINLLNDVVDICKSKKLNILLRETYYILYKIYKDFNFSGEAPALKGKSISYFRIVLILKLKFQFLILSTE
ncbi:MAG: hypothetical protein SA378_03585, partial [Sedimentibacter sp.]|uniref:tetratricopeptide repeat protein n=1 Tax=Sedimentibacter sp. TaxID=1960295 RepID=UPI002980DA9D